MASNQPRESDSHKTFEELARELECDEDEAAFEEKVRKVARAPEPEPEREKTK